MNAMIITIVVVVGGGIAFTLWWWRLADRWADAEHKRFKAAPPDQRERIVVRGEAGDSPRSPGP